MYEADTDTQLEDELERAVAAWRGRTVEVIDRRTVGGETTETRWQGSPLAVTTSHRDHVGMLARVVFSGGTLDVPKQTLRSSELRLPSGRWQDAQRAARRGEGDELRIVCDGGREIVMRPAA